MVRVHRQQKDLLDKRTTASGRARNSHCLAQFHNGLEGGRHLIRNCSAAGTLAYLLYLNAVGACSNAKIAAKCALFSSGRKAKEFVCCRKRPPSERHERVHEYRVTRAAYNCIVYKNLFSNASKSSCMFSPLLGWYFDNKKMTFSNGLLSCTSFLISVAKIRIQLREN